MKKVRVGIIGSGGYTGGELIRLLVNHPEVDLVFAHSQSQKGKKLYDTHPDLLGETEMEFTAQLEDPTDILFLCLGHGESRVFLDQNLVSESIRIIDLSQDFRIENQFQNRKFIYGLPELKRTKIKSARNIANPGCFASAIQFALLPLIHQKEPVQDWVIFGTTGSTGAGQSLNPNSHFSWRNQNLSIYKAFNHQHLEEINNTFSGIQPLTNFNLHFIPQRGNFSRGIMISAVLESPLPLSEIEKIFRDYYENEPFVFISNRNIDLKSVVNTNKVFISFEKQGDNLLINCVLDNLLKGASGQALQNMNIMMGLEETLGLKLKSIGY